MRSTRRLTMGAETKGSRIELAPLLSRINALHRRLCFHHHSCDACKATRPRLPYERRNRDLDPQLIWRGKDEQDWSDLVVHAPPLYIQGKVHPKVLIDDLRRRCEADAKAAEDQIDLFANFNGLPSEAAKTEFYQ